MTAQLALGFDDALRERDAALRRIETVTSADFRERGRRFVLAYLAAHGPTPGETLTAEGERVGGLRPTDLRHWGCVFQALSRRGEIRCVGYCARVRGHGTAGGRIWDLSRG